MAKGATPQQMNYNGVDEEATPHEGTMKPHAPYAQCVYLNGTVLFNCETSANMIGSIQIQNQPRM